MTLCTPEEKSPLIPYQRSIELLSHNSLGSEHQDHDKDDKTDGFLISRGKEQASDLLSQSQNHSAHEGAHGASQASQNRYDESLPYQRAADKGRNGHDGGNQGASCSSQSGADAHGPGVEFRHVHADGPGAFEIEGRGIDGFASLRLYDEEIEQAGKDESDDEDAEADGRNHQISNDQTLSALTGSYRLCRR